MKIVETSKKTYLAEEVVETSGGMTQLNGAVAVDSYDDRGDMAFKYLKATLLENLISIKVKAQALESIEEATDISKIINKLSSNMPEAKKRAEVKAILNELSEMLDMDYNDSDDDD